MSVFTLAQKVGALDDEDYARFKEWARYFRGAGAGRAGKGAKGKGKRKYTRRRKGSPEAPVVIQKERKPRVKRGPSEEIDHSPKRPEE